MHKSTRFYLVISLVCLAAGALIATGVIPVGDVAAAHVVLPVGAVFFGVFLISCLLGRASARPPEEQAADDRPGGPPQSGPTAGGGCGCGCQPADSH